MTDLLYMEEVEDVLTRIPDLFYTKEEDHVLTLMLELCPVPDTNTPINTCTEC